LSITKIKNIVIESNFYFETIFELLIDKYISENKKKNFDNFLISILETDSNKTSNLIDTKNIKDAKYNSKKTSKFDSKDVTKKDTKKDKKRKTTSIRRVVIDSCVSCLVRTMLLKYSTS